MGTELFHDCYWLKVRAETSPEDVGGMHAAAGILTARGGMTSHAAVVARGWGKCCVSGCSDIQVNDNDKVKCQIFLSLYHTSFSKIIVIEWVNLIKCADHCRWGCGYK